MITLYRDEEIAQAAEEILKYSNGVRYFDILLHEAGDQCGCTSEWVEARGFANRGNYLVAIKVRTLADLADLAKIGPVNSSNVARAKIIILRGAETTDGELFQKAS
jgi:hypothetical protein